MNNSSSLHPKLLPWLREAFDTKVNIATAIQPLWNQYGQIARFFSPKHNTHFIVKLISPNSQATHPKGWQSSVSHDRKCKSYIIETNFYELVHKELNFPESLCIPTLIFVDKGADQSILLVLSDLNLLGFTQSYSALTAEHCRPALNWLAQFHSLFLNKNTSGIWPRGTYWHLATRQDEWQAMKNSPLKEWAITIDEKISNAKFKTWVHGDAKVANFCFSTNNQVAAVDFQYVGGGIGVQDVAYFLGSALTNEDLIEHTDGLIQYYFECLTHWLSIYQPKTNAQLVIKEWQELYNVCVADFHRFLAGWSPGHWKINSDMKQRTLAVLNSI